VDFGDGGFARIDQTELLQFERGWALIYGVITPKRSGATSKCGANFLTMLARLTT
jgi:hypothetical protein